MSDIKVGDLVVVVKDGNCVCSPHPSPLLGQVFTVTEMGNPNGACSHCGHPLPTGVGVKGYRATEVGWLNINRLRRIPPLAQLDDIERKQEEPA